MLCVRVALQSRLSVVQYIDGIFHAPLARLNQGEQNLEVNFKRLTRRHL